MQAVKDGNHWICGDCGANALYRDDDRITGARCVACKICGGRDYGPVKIETIHIERERDMKPKTRACDNCGRVKVIVADDKCFVCRKASKGLTGAAREKALAEIKGRVERGEFRGCGKKPKAKTAPAAPSVIPAKAGIQTELKTRRLLPEIIPGSMELREEPAAEPAREIPITIRLNIEVRITPVGIGQVAQR